MARKPAESGGVAIAGAFIGMWLTYAVTSSVGLAWVAFFVVGAALFGAARS